MSPQSQNFITLTKDDPRFMQYLLGDNNPVEADLMPLPVHSLNLQRGNEAVTFQLVPAAQIKKPWYWFAKLMRLELLLLTLSPVVMVAAVNAQAIKDSFELVLALVALFFLHISVYCANDFLDHIGGLDRVSDKGGSHVIQRGWITARNVRRVGLVSLAVAFLSALPIFIEHQELAILSLALIAILGLGYKLSRWGSPSPVLGFFILLGLFGPMLTLSTEWLLVHTIGVRSAVMGLFTGGLAITYVHAKQILSMATDQEAKITSVAILLGVDRAVLLLKILCVAVFALFILTLNVHWGLMRSIWGFASVPLLIEMLMTVRRVSSPFSSSLLGFFRRLLVFYATAVLIFVLGSLLT